METGDRRKRSELKPPGADNWQSTVPERACLAAILERALLDSCGSTISKNRREELTQKARYWVLEWGESDYEVPFTFPWICAHLDVCPRRVRACARRLMRSPKPPKHSALPWSQVIRKMLSTTATELEVYY